MENSIDLIVVAYSNAEFFLKNNYSQLMDYGIRIIMVDNNSNEEICKRYPDIEYINSGENLGYGSAVNIGFKYVNADYAIICNDDIIINSFNLKKILRRKNQYKDNDCSVIGFNVMSGQSGRRGVHRGIYNPYVILYHNSFIPVILSMFSNRPGYAGVFETLHYHKSSKRVRGVSGSFFMVKSSMFRKMGGFDSNYFLTYEEIDLFRRFIMNNLKIYYDHDVYIRHLHGFTSKRSMLTEAYKSMSYFLSKFYPNIKWPVEITVLIWLTAKLLFTGDNYAIKNFLSRK